MSDLPLDKIISGGQTGVDTGGLIAADLLGLSTGGWAPQGWKDENGTNEVWMRAMGMKECYKAGYPARTEANVREGNATLIISHERKLTGGTYDTLCCAEAMDKAVKQVWMKLDKKGKPSVFEVVDGSLSVCRWLGMIECRTLNVAGPRESKCPGIGEWVCEYLLDILS